MTRGICDIDSLSRLLVLEGSELPFGDDYKAWGLLSGLKALIVHK